jgi:hypothetical protein
LVLDNAVEKGSTVLLYQLLVGPAYRQAGVAASGAKAEATVTHGTNQIMQENHLQE